MEAEEWGQEEYQQSKRAAGGTEGCEGKNSLEVRSASHDVLSVGRGRDYRGFVLFYNELVERNNITIRVIDLRIREEGGYILTANLFTGTGRNSYTPMVALLAYRHHMGWLKMCEDTLAGDQKSRKEDFRDHLQCFKVTGWEVMVDGEKGIAADRIPTLNPCRFRKKCVQTPYDPETFYGKDIGMGRIACGRTKCIKDEPYACGMMQGVVSYPFLNMNWRVPGPLCPLAVEYRNAVDVEFPLLSGQNVETLGNRLARECGDIRLAERRAQEIEMMKLEPQARSAAALLHNQPALLGGIAQLHTIGALPHFQGKPPETPRHRVLPFDASQTIEIVQKL